MKLYVTSDYPWHALDHAAKFALKSKNYCDVKGFKNCGWVSENGQKSLVSFRIAEKRKFIYEGADYGKHWKTLDDLEFGPVQIVVVATVNDPEHPKKVEVFQLDANEVRKRLRAHHNMMNSKSVNPKVSINLDKEKSGLPSLASIYSPIEVFKLKIQPLEWKILLQNSKTS